MTDRPLTDRLDDTIDTLLARGDASGALRDTELAPLARLAADVRHYPDPEFKARLRTQLERRTTMTTATATPTAIREGFTTVTPYLRVSGPGLVDFLKQVFDAEETLAAPGGSGGTHREVRIGDSMVMIGEGSSNVGTPARPAALHVFVKDADATYAKAIAAGATSLGEPADRPYGERSGFVKDAFGNHWYIATPLGAMSVAHSLRAVTAFLHAPDPVAYIAFMERGLGAVVEMRHDEGGRFRYGLLRIGDGAVELGPADPMPVQLLVHVTDPDASYQRAIEAGATSMMPPTEMHYGRMATVQDMVGNVWFFQRPSPTI